MKKQLLIIITILSFFTLTGCTSTKIEENDKNDNRETVQQTYIIQSGELGEYGKEIILNKNTDLPAKKYLYKLPSGKYTVTTKNEKYSTFWIVKDEVVNTGTENYPEELSYVGNQHMLTAGDNLLNGTATKEDIVTINDDESILLIQGDLTFIK